MPARPGIEKLAPLVNLFTAGARTVRRTSFDPAAIVDAEGHDPQRLFLWVRDHTWWVPYRGILRGSKGVLLDRVGNALDRSLLLADLMRHAGHTVRLAHEQLADAKGTELLGRIQRLPNQRMEPPPEALSIEAADFVKNVETVLPGSAKLSAAVRENARRRTDRATALIREQAGQLTAAMHEATTIPPPEDIGPSLAAIQDHWWVEYDSHGSWIAMDTLLPDSQPGATQGPASETVDWPSNAASPAFRGDLWHEVQIRVVIERYQQGTTNESTVLESTLRPTDVLGQQVSLGHIPKPFPKDLHLGRDVDAKSVKAELLKATEWTPILRIGQRRFGKASFTDRGEVRASPGGGGGTGGLLGGLESAFGGGDAGEGQVTAEWIDYEIRAPGRPPQRVRRPVFDLLGPIRRATKEKDFDANSDARRLERAGLLLGRTDILLQPCDFTPDFVASTRASNIVANQAALLEIAGERDPAKTKALARQLTDRMEDSSPLPDLALWRSRLAPSPGDVFLDRPNVLTYRLSLTISETPEVKLSEWIDIAANSVSVRRGAGRNALDIRAEQGVTDTLAEALAMGGEPGRADNTASVFAMTAFQHGSVKLVTTRSAESTRGFEWSAEALARLADDLPDGYVALAPVRSVTMDGRSRVGWWRVHRQSGDTIGVMDTGFRQEMPERVVGESQQSYAYRLVRWFESTTDAEKVQLANKMTANGTGYASGI